jgi:hypothetical protein
MFRGTTERSPRGKGITTLRKLPFAVLLAVPAASACTSLLGDFSTGGPAYTGGDATTDDGAVATSDGAGTQDAPMTVVTSDASDGGTSSSVEAGPEAGSAPKLLACDETSNQRVNLTLNVNGAGPEELQYENLAIASLPGSNGEVRIIAAANAGFTSGAAANNSTLHAFTFTPNATLVSDTVLTLGAGDTNVFDIERYPGGFAVLVQNYNPTTNTAYLAIELIADSANAWSPEYPVTSGAPANPAPDTQMSGALAVVDAATDEFYVALYDTEGPANSQTDYLRWQHAMGTSTLGPLHLVTDSLAMDTYRLAVPNFAYDMSNSYILLQPAGAGTGGSTSILYTISAMGIGPGKPVPVAQTLTPPAMGDTLHALAMTNSVLTMGAANFAFLEGDLNTALLSYYVGQSPISGLGSFAWQSLTQSSPGIDDAGYSIEDLPVNNAAYHWESFPTPASVASENLLAVATVGTNQSLTGDQGVNLVWFDAVAGTIRAGKTGPRRLLSDVSGLGNLYANATFAGPPTTLLTNILLVYEVPTSDAGDDGSEDIWLTQVNCSAP